MKQFWLLWNQFESKKRWCDVCITRLCLHKKASAFFCYSQKTRHPTGLFYIFIQIHVKLLIKFLSDTFYFLSLFTSVLLFQLFCCLRDFSPLSFFMLWQSQLAFYGFMWGPPTIANELRLLSAGEEKDIR